MRTDTGWGTFSARYFGGCGEAEGTRSFKVLDISPHRVSVLLLTRIADEKQSLSLSQELLPRVHVLPRVLAKLSSLQIPLLTF